MSDDGSNDPGTTLPEAEVAAPKAEGQGVAAGEKPAESREPESAEGPEKAGPPLTLDQVRDALALLSAHFQAADLTYAELDQRMGRRPNFTGRVMRGEIAYTHRIGRALRAAMGLDEKQFEDELAQRQAIREFQAETPSLVPSPHKPKARHPRRRPGHQPASERPEGTSALHEPEVLDKLKKLEKVLRAQLRKRRRQAKRKA
jgi:hypothetical protein